VRLVSRKIGACALLLLWLPLAASAHDLGVRGTVFAIAEPSLLVQIIEKLSAVDWKQKSADLLAKAKHGLHHYVQDGLTPADETATRYIDQSVTLQKPISAPVKEPDGQSVWRVIDPAGTRFNPLDKLQPVTRMLVFDPRVASQTAFALAAMHAWPDLIELVATGGDIKAVSKQIQRPLFYASTSFVQRFQLRHTPTLIGVGKGPLDNRLAVTEFGPAQATAKAAVTAVRAAWYGLPRVKKGKTSGGAIGGITNTGDNAHFQGRHS